MTFGGMRYAYACKIHTTVNGTFVAYGWASGVHVEQNRFTWKLVIVKTICNPRARVVKTESSLSHRVVNDSSTNTLVNTIVYE